MTPAGFPIAKQATADKPQSKLWYHTGSWWCIVDDGEEGGFFFRMRNGLWEKLGPSTSFSSSGYLSRADVVSEDGQCWVLTWQENETRFSAYEYVSDGDSYRLRPGFPVGLKLLPGNETAVLARDSANVFWITYEAGGEVYVSRSEDGFHWQENQVLGTGLADDDISAVIAFENRIGVFWSDQNRESLLFRTRSDLDPLGEWQEVELVAAGGLVADDHVNLAAEGGRVYAVTKTSVDDSAGEVAGAQIILSVRSNGGVWVTYDVEPVSEGDATRPIIVLDKGNETIYIFFTKGSEIVFKAAPFDEIDFSQTAIPVISVPGVKLNNVTSTKQNVDSETGLLVLAGGSDGRAYHRLLDLY